MNIKIGQLRAADRLATLLPITCASTLAAGVRTGILYNTELSGAQEMKHIRPPH